MTTAHISEGNNTADLSGRRLTVVFIDCTWYQVHKIATDPRLSSKFSVLVCSALQSYSPRDCGLGLEALVSAVFETEQ